MKTPRFRAVILAAGLGTRLRPLTLSLPKPLLPVAGGTVLGHTLLALQKAGCEEVAINLHYQGEKIASRFGSEFEGMPLRYSREERIRGTLGALVPLREFLSGSEYAVVLNGDTLARWPLVKLLRHQQQSLPQATVMVSSRARVEEYGGGIGIGANGRVTSFVGADSQRGGVGGSNGLKSSKEIRRRVFAGAHVFSPRLLKRLVETPLDFVRDLYQPMVDRGERIDAVESSDLWFDLGTPRRYLDGIIGWAGRGGWRRGGWKSTEAEVDREASVRSSVLEAGVRVGPGTRLRRSLVLSGASIGAGSRVTDSVIGFSVDLPPGTIVENRLVTEARADTPPHGKASVVGGLVYGPLDEE